MAEFVVAIGVPAALVGDGFVSSLLFGLHGADFLSLLIAVTLLGTGRLHSPPRAANLDPMVALRYACNEQIISRSLIFTTRADPRTKMPTRFGVINFAVQNCEGGFMSKVLRCADVVGSCDFVARGDSEQEILRQASEHARSAHNIDEITPEVAEKVRAAIRDEAA